MMLVFLEIISIGIGLIQPLGMKVALYNGLVLLILLILDAVFLIILRRIQKTGAIAGSWNSDGRKLFCLLKTMRRRSLKSMGLPVPARMKRQPGLPH